MSDRQVHRGPDDSGTFIHRDRRGLVGFGHRRLSIIDLSPEGHQPMVDPGSGAVLVYNGELYNFRSLRADLERQGCRFRGHSDTEVLLQALVRWGEACLDRLCGMFALAFYDPSHGAVLLARDPLGIKPLYVARRPGLLLFASEVRAILASGLVPRSVDRRAVAGYLAYGAVQAPDTIVRDVHAFPPGSAQWIDRAGDPAAAPPPRRLWTPPAPSPTSEDEAVAGYAEVLERAVGEHLVSDVPLGVLLSSGLDSTVLATLATHHASDLRTFTVGFADHPDLDESPLAEETARLLGARHRTVSVTPESCLPLVERWLAALDQPSMDGLNVYVIAQVIAAQGITVVLSGTGGDELFGGYPSFRDVPRMLPVVKRLRWLPPAVRAGLGTLAAAGRSRAVREKLSDLLRSRGDVVSLCLLRRRAMSDRQLHALGLDAAALDLHPLFVPRPAIDGVCLRPEDPVWMVSQLESMFYQGNVLLRDGDTNGMAHSLEIRVPFLDRRVLDLAMALPGPVRLPNGTADKHLTRRAFRSALRPALSGQRKRPFALPIRRWMGGPLAPLCEAALDHLKQSGLVREAGVDNLWRSFRNEPESPIWSRAWSMCVLGRYLAEQGL